MALILILQLHNFYTTSLLARRIKKGADIWSNKLEHASYNLKSDKHSTVKSSWSTFTNVCLTFFVFQKIHIEKPRNYSYTENTFI